MKFWIFIFGILAVSACKYGTERTQVSLKSKDSLDPFQSKADPTRFPNERSELAILMRNLNDDLTITKQQIEKGSLPEVNWVKKYAAISTAIPTDSNDSGPVFHAFSKKFLADLEAFENSDSSNRVETFNAMIQSCLDCHQEHCHGPMVAIRKLKI